MDEYYYERLLNIKTLGEQESFYQSFHYYRYEPTSYAALDQLSKHYEFTADDKIVDFGSGKGRFAFYMNYFFEASVTGIEMNRLFYDIALQNKNTYKEAHKNKQGSINFVNCLAESYKIKPNYNKFYFFNPFSVHIFAKVLENILISKEENDRTVDLILYYPSPEYIFYLGTRSPFALIDDIKVSDTIDSDPRENLLIFRF